MALIPFIFLLFFRREGKYLGYSSTIHLKGAKSFKAFLRRLPRYLCFLAIIFAILAFSKPQSDYHETEITFQGREMILSLDTSFSMTGIAMENIRNITKDFVNKRSNDLIGITIYGTDAAVIVMPTWETQLLEKSIDRIKARQLGNRTAIGEGILTSIMALIEKDLGEEIEIKQLRKSMNKMNRIGKYALNFAKLVERKGTMKNKVIILFTDGIYNMGMNPVRSLRFAKRLGIKVHVVFFTSSGETGVEPDQAEERIADLKKGVESTGGKYFEAEDYKQVEHFFGEIDKIEKDKIVVEKIRKKKDMFFIPTVVSICFLIGMIIVENIWLKFP